jgi:hypothetical protein
MNSIFNDLFLLQRIDNLIRTKATGSPDELADRLESYKRTTERLISDLRDKGFPVAYNKDRKTYYYTEEVKIRFEVIVNQEPMFRIQGGRDNNFEKKLQTAIFWR